MRMRMFTAFIKKELIESVRTYKFFILMIIFMLFGIMNPIMAKMMPEILESFLPKGMSIAIATPTALDSWAQFFKNVSQMGLIILAIIFSGIISNEFSKGTLINMLTKGLSRPIVILSKFTAALLIWTTSYILCSVLTYCYTIYFWNMDNVHNLYLSISGLWIFGGFLIASLIFGGILFKNNFGGLLFTFGSIIVMMILSIAPNLQKFNPISLITLNMGLITKQVKVGDFYLAIVVCIGLTIAYILSSIIIFNKKQV